MPCSSTRGYDFEPYWLKLVAQMVNPATTSLLVAVRRRPVDLWPPPPGQAQLQSLGIQAQGRTTILKINYRNTREVLELASGVAKELLARRPPTKTAYPRWCQSAPAAPPGSPGRQAAEPAARADYVADHLKPPTGPVPPWRDMAVITAITGASARPCWPPAPGRHPGDLPRRRDLW